MRNRAEYLLALLLDALGGAAVLLVGVRAWSSIHVYRARPLADVTLRITGRSIDNASTAFALVALAGAVAVIALRGWPRRIVGVVLAAAGLGVAVRSVQAVSITHSRAGEFVQSRLHAAGITNGFAVTSHPLWAWLSAAAGVLILASGAMIAWRGAGWAAMSGRYDAPAETIDPDTERSRADIAMWRALDRGDDPTQPP
jgi:uncharacterized membrane protein (TIGR02234 family)